MKRQFVFFCFCFSLTFFGNGQVVINEIFPDPEPSIDLPSEEFLELYNTSNEAISLQDWQISDASSTKTINQNFVLQPNSFAILCADEYEDLFSPFGEVVVVSSLPSLNNSGDELTLTKPNGEISDVVNYKSAWYNDPLKASGGWTLERRNPLNQCDGAANWSASNDSNGGTPGGVNSIEDFNFQDEREIEIESVYLIEEDLLEVVFNKAPDGEELQTAWSIVPFLPVSFVEQSPDRLTAFFHFEEALIESQLYEISFVDLVDCSGLSEVSGNYQFGRATMPERGELLLNEILFNSATGGVDFVEIVNVSDKLFSFNSLSILELDPFTDEVVDFETLEDVNRYLFPDTLYVLTTNSEALQEQYDVVKPQNIIEASIPNYPNEEGKIALLNQSLDTLDVLQYHEDWHFEGLNRVDGVSLERLSLNAPTQEETNWFSASYIAGNATPTGENSQNESVAQTMGDELILSAEIFTPDGDGMDDFLTISFTEQTNGTTANIAVYDARGFLVKTIVNNQLIGSFNQFCWTGLNEENQPVALGHYFIVAELFDTDGKKAVLKEKVVVSRR